MTRYASLLAALLWCWPASAAAAELWVETAPLGTRAQAEEALARLPAGELDEVLGEADARLRVQRRFEPGQGWGYVVRIEGLETVSSAEAAAAWLADQGLSAALWSRDGGVAERLGEAQVDASAATGPQTAEGTARSQAEDASAQRVLRAAARAHGGVDGGVELVSQALAVVFDFERTVSSPEGELLAANRFRRLGDAVRLEVDIVEGPGVDSRTLLTAGNEAWVSTGEAAPLARDPARTREVLVRFSPEGVLSIPLGIARDLTTAAEWRDLVFAGTDTRGEVATIRLEPAGDAGGGDGLVAAWFEQEQARLAAVQWATPAGVMEFAFGDYRELAKGLVVPFRVEVRRDGALVESIRVLELSLPETLEPAGFDAL